MKKLCVTNDLYIVLKYKIKKQSKIMICTPPPILGNKKRRLISPQISSVPPSFNPPMHKKRKFNFATDDNICSNIIPIFKIKNERRSDIISNACFDSFSLNKKLLHFPHPSPMSNMSNEPVFVPFQFQLRSHSLSAMKDICSPIAVECKKSKSWSPIREWNNKMSTTRKELHVNNIHYLLPKQRIDKKPMKQRSIPKCKRVRNFNRIKKLFFETKNNKKYRIEIQCKKNRKMFDNYSIDSQTNGSSISPYFERIQESKKYREQKIDKIDEQLKRYKNQPFLNGISQLLNTHEINLQLIFNKNEGKTNVRNEQNVKQSMTVGSASPQSPFRPPPVTADSSLLEVMQECLNVYGNDNEWFAHVITDNMKCISRQQTVIDTMGITDVLL